MSIKPRLKRLESEFASRGIDRIDPKDRIVAITYRNGDMEEYDRQKQERVAELRGRYGRDLSESDLLFIGIRKFYARTS